MCSHMCAARLTTGTCTKHFFVTGPNSTKPYNTNARQTACVAASETASETASVDLFMNTAMYMYHTPHTVQYCTAAESASREERRCVMIPDDCNCSCDRSSPRGWCRRRTSLAMRQLMPMRNLEAADLGRARLNSPVAQLCCWSMPFWAGHQHMRQDSRSHTCMITEIWTSRNNHV